LIFAVSVSGLITYFVLNQSSPRQAVSFKAAIVDQLSATFPNQSFNDNAKTLLADAGYTVDYYGPDKVTVEFFRGLPSKGYGLVIIRAHSTGHSNVPGEDITIFTSEPYDPNRYQYEQLTNQVFRASLGTNLTEAELGKGRLYFAISSSFVEHSMQGRFPNSIIIMMGCTGLKNSNMAQAFVSKGARVYVSWENSVTPDRTDNATTALLRSLAQGKTVGQAVRATMIKIGPDPVYNSQLGYYPQDSGGMVLNIGNSQT